MKVEFSTQAIPAVFLILLACVAPRQESGNDVVGQDLSGLKTTGIAVVDWSCFGKGKEHPVGRNSQEEYCEWTREPVAFNGVGSLVSGGPEQAITLPKACVFNTSFDQTREFFLTQKVVGVPGKFENQSLPFWGTQFNSYAFLVGGNEPDTRAFRKGIIGHCIERKSCFQPNCVPDRASDPQICAALNTLGNKGCKVDTGFEVAPVVTAGKVAKGRIGDQIIKPQLAVRPTRAASCYYARDPKFSQGAANASEQRTLFVCDASPSLVPSKNCDDYAPDLSLSIQLKIEDTRCVGGAGLPAGVPVVSSAAALKENSVCKILSTTPANVRNQPSLDSVVLVAIPQNFEVLIRGFIGDWVSVQFKTKVEDVETEFGAQPGKNAFISKSQFMGPDGRPSCREQL